MPLSWLDPYLLAVVDSWFALRPRAPLDRACLQRARIVSHRGERSKPSASHSGALENTYAAFDPLIGRVWGLECDIRFSRDGVPMVFHDADLRRIFNCHERLSDLSAAQLAQRFPLIPRLDDFAQRYGGKIHLMMEFKAEHRPDPDQQIAALSQALQHLQPAQDFHFMALQRDTLDWLRQRWQQALVAIARSNVAEMSEYALQHRLAGMTGHYALLHKPRVSQHIQADQWVGLGFPESRHCLRYTLAQGAQYIFSNQALAMQAVLEREKSSSKS